jgi:hypothetical protein
MRKYEIAATHMNIDLFTMPPEITGTTLYMPSWSSFESFWSIFRFKMCFPEILAIGFIISFPESEITETLFFVFILFDPCSGFHTFQVEMSEITVFFETLDIKVD